MEYPNSQRYEVENRNKIIGTFSDIFEYCSLIDIQNYSSIDSSEHLILKQRSAEIDISSSSCIVKLKLDVHNNE